jgi:hypothetical protein
MRWVYRALSRLPDSDRQTEEPTPIEPTTIACGRGRRYGQTGRESVRHVPADDLCHWVVSYTGIACAEYANLGGARRTEGTGLGTAIMFAGALLIPSSFSLAVAALGGYGVAYGTLAMLALASALLLCLGSWTSRAAPA